MSERTTKKSPTPKWGTRWLATLDKSKALSNAALERGQAYALHDWQLEVDLEPGKAEALARSGPRIRNRAIIGTPTFSSSELELIVGLIASSSARTAAVLDHDLDLSLMDEAKAAGVNLLPAPRSLKADCSCRNWGELCKHAAAILFLLGGVFDEAPFDLLLWRGLPYEELVARIRTARGAEPETATGTDDASGDQAQQTGDDDTSAGADSSATTPDAGDSEVDALQAWAVSTEENPMPAPLAGPTTEVVVAPYPSDAPANAPFTSQGLHSLLSDAVSRAFAQRDTQSSSALGLPLEADLARRAAAAEGGDNWSGLVRHSSRPSRELSALANAWRVAGADGVEVLQSSTQTMEIDKQTQLRQDKQNQWFRFEKISGRWKLVEGPAPTHGELNRSSSSKD